MYTKNLESIYREHEFLINMTICRNRSLLTALRLEDEDVSQQLAVAMLLAVKRFDLEGSVSLESYIRHSLHYEILNIKRKHKPCGITGVPKGCRLNLIYLDNMLKGGSRYGAVYSKSLRGTSALKMSGCLTEEESEAGGIKMDGYPVSNRV